MRSMDAKHNQSKKRKKAKLGISWDCGACPFLIPHRVYDQTFDYLIGSIPRALGMTKSHSLRPPAILKSLAPVALVAGTGRAIDESHFSLAVACRAAQREREGEKQSQIGTEENIPRSCTRDPSPLTPLPLVQAVAHGSSP